MSDRADMSRQVRRAAARRGDRPAPAEPPMPVVDPELARTGRMAALVIAGTMLLWMAATWLGSKLGLDRSYAFLFDFAALAAFIWSLVVIVRLWRRQRQAGR